MARSRGSVIISSGDSTSSNLRASAFEMSAFRSVDKPDYHVERWVDREGAELPFIGSQPGPFVGEADRAAARVLGYGVSDSFSGNRP
jgi:hypothetical protein